MPLQSSIINTKIDSDIYDHIDHDGGIDGQIKNNQRMTNQREQNHYDNDVGDSNSKVRLQTDDGEDRDDVFSDAEYSDFIQRRESDRHITNKSNRRSMFRFTLFGPSSPSSSTSIGNILIRSLGPFIGERFKSKFYSNHQSDDQIKECKPKESQFYDQKDLFPIVSFESKPLSTSSSSSSMFPLWRTLTSNCEAFF